MDNDSLAMHFDEVHPDDISVPRCNLCLQELIMNARIAEKFGEEYDITLPDEHHIKYCSVQSFMLCTWLLLLCMFSCTSLWFKMW